MLLEKENIKTYTCCSVCGNSTFKKVVETKDFTVSNEVFEVLECKSCSFKFTQNIPIQSKIGKYYASEDYISHSDTKEGLINKLYHFARNFMLNSKAKLLEKNNQSNSKNLLDIGCGTGYFLNTMKNKSWNITGIEADEGARSLAISNFDLQVFDVEKLFQFNQKFDTITMWHVLEHIHDLNEYIKQCYELLSENGTLIIAVPNANSFDAKYYKANWAAWDVPRHLYHFTPQSMQKLLEKHQFKIVQKKLMPFDPFYIALLSEKYKKSALALIKGFTIGKISLLNAIFNVDKASSVIYVIKKQKNE